MSARRTTATWSTCGFLLMATCHHGIAAERASETPQQTGGPGATAEHTGSVTLGMLSVKPLAVDRPWDPHVCIGCERNNGPTSDQRRAHRPR